MKIGAVGGSYTAISNDIADEEAINWYVETNETPGAQVPKSLIRTPGLKAFATLTESPTRCLVQAENRCFAVGGSKLCEIMADGSVVELDTIGTDGNLVSIAASNLQLLIVSALRAWCFDLKTSVLTEVTALLAGQPIQVAYSDGYFIVIFKDSNKFQVSDLFDGTTWPGLQVSAVSVFPENLTSILVNNRQLGVFGGRHIQWYGNTGSDEIFDPIPGAFVEKGCGPTFSPCRVDNTTFWIHQDERGSRMAWRANGYTPLRISTHAVETYLDSVADVSNLVSYAYQEAGHEFWVLYLPGTDCSWAYDAAENVWCKRAKWDTASATYGPHPSWVHANVFGKNLVGDWSTGKVYDMSLSYLDDDGDEIRRLRRFPILANEMKWINYGPLTLDFNVGIGPQPPLTDGAGDPRPPQVMLRWSDNRGSTWSNQRILDCGLAGEYLTRVIAWRLGRSRYRVFEMSVTDPVAWVLVDAYLDLAA